MKHPEPDAHAVASFRKFYALLPRGDDLSLLILKLHLLVEEQVRAYVDQRLPNKAALAKAKPDCFLAICLAEALCTDEIQSHVWDAAKKINALRNHVAHNLDMVGVIVRMNNISSMLGVPHELSSIEGKTPQEVAVENFSFAVNILHSKLSIFVHRKPAAVLSIVQRQDDA